MSGIQMANACRVLSSLFLNMLGIELPSYSTSHCIPYSHFCTHLKNQGGYAYSVTALQSLIPKFSSFGVPAPLFSLWPYRDLKSLDPTFVSKSMSCFWFYLLTGISFQHLQSAHSFVLLMQKPWKAFFSLQSLTLDWYFQKIIGL